MDSVVGEAGDICVCVDDPAIPDLNNPGSVVDQKKKRNGTYSMQFGRMVSKYHVKVIATSRDTGRMQRLRDIAQEMRNPFQRIRTLQILTMHKLPLLGSRDTALEYLRLIRNGRNHATAFRAVTIIIHIAIIGRVVCRIDPMPLVGKSAFGGVGVVVCPGCC